MTEPGWGAYGLSVGTMGMPARSWLNRCPDDWPELRLIGAADGVGRPRAHDDDVSFVVDGPRLRLESGTGWRLALDLEASTATVCGVGLNSPEIVHPGLSPVATLFARWHGRGAFHAGGFVAGEHAWGVVGEREAGKTTLLAALAARDVPIVADDLLVTDSERVFAGPRCLDLRDHLPDGLPTVPVRGGHRQRLPLATVAPTVPFAGWVFLGWGDEVTLRPVTAADRLRALAPARMWTLVGDDRRHFLHAASLPCWRLTRPRRREGIQRTAAILVDMLSG